MLLTWHKEKPPCVDRGSVDHHFLDPPHFPERKAWSPSQFDKYFLKLHYNFCNIVNSRKTCWCLQSSKEWNRHKIVRELFNISNEISRIFSSHCTCTQPSSVARLVLQNTLFGTNLWFLRNLKIKISRYLKKYQEILSYVKKKCELISKFCGLLRISELYQTDTWNNSKYVVWSCVRSVQKYTLEPGVCVLLQHCSAL